MDTLFFLFSFLNFQKLCCILSSSSSVCGAVCWCRSGDCPFRVHRGRSLEARDQSLLFPSFLLSFFLSLFILSCGSSSSLIGAVQSADSPFMADGGRGRGCWNAGTFQSGQQFFITAFLAQSCCRGSRGKGVFKAGRSWISFLPSSFPLAFSYLSV